MTSFAPNTRLINVKVAPKQPRLLQLNLEVTITKEGNFTAADLDVLEEVNIFEGRENSITFQQVYSKTFKCEYELQERYWSSS